MPLPFDELYRLYATDVLRVSYYYLGSREQAEDVTQDVFVRLIINHPDLEPGREKAWLLKVALNRCRDLWRGAWFRKVNDALEYLANSGEEGTFDKLVVRSNDQKTSSRFSFVRNGELVLGFEASKIFFNKPSGKTLR